MAITDLTIPESLLLLSLQDESGERKGTFVPYALAGAALTELLLRGRLAEAGDPARKLDVIDPGPVGDPYVDACLAAVIEKGSGKSAKSYVERLGGKSSLLEPLYNRLVDRGILGKETSTILFVFDRTTYPEADPAPERALKARLTSAISGTGPVDPHDSVVIALAHHTDLLRHNFDRELLKSRKARIKSISDGDLLPPNAAIQTIKSMQAAVMIAAIMPAVIVTTST